MSQLRLFWITALFSAFAAPCALAAPAAHAAVAPASTGDLQAVMNPGNPFNGGTDPVTMPEDARLAVFPFSDDQIYRLLTAPLKTTSIELAKGEKLLSDPALADNIEWDIDTDGANHIYIKPHKPGLVNTLELVTNKHTYDFTLVSSPLGGMFYQRVRFRYGDSILTKLATPARMNSTAAADTGNDGETPADSGSIGVSPDKANFNYTVTGSAEFKPDVVFDNGKFIWLRIPESSQIWPVPFIDDAGDSVQPNFIRRGRFIVVENLANKVVLRAGRQTVTITRKSNHLFGLL
jgi:type IV secretion system protein VirB9